MRRAKGFRSLLKPTDFSRGLLTSFSFSATNIMNCFQTAESLALSSVILFPQVCVGEVIELFLAFLDGT